MFESPLPSVVIIRTDNQGLQRSTACGRFWVEDFLTVPAESNRYPTEILMTDNPYTSPTVEDSPILAESSPKIDTTLAAIAKPTFLSWERLRVVFLIVLGLLTLLLAGPNLNRFRTIVLIVEGAIVANVCFFAGPIVETYVRWLGYDRKWVRWFLFVGGTALTAMLAAATLVNMFMPDQD